jgi:hypothetical protein
VAGGLRPAVVKPFGPWQRHLSVAEVAGQLQRSGDQAGSFDGDGRQLAAVVGGNQLGSNSLRRCSTWRKSYIGLSDDDL